MNCPNCGKEISDDSKYCPNCGTTIPLEVKSEGEKPHYYNREDEKVSRNNVGMWGFLFSIVSLFLSVYLVIPALGIIFSGIGYARRRKFKTWNRISLAGLIISIVLFAFYLIYYILDGFGFAIFF